MKTVHFVYSLPYSNKLAYLIQERLLHRRFVHGVVDDYKWPSPLSAPSSITYNLGRFLENKYKIKLYDLRERVNICPGPGDILIGHAWPDKKSIIWNALKNPIFERKYLIGPYNNDATQVEWMRDAVDQCDKFFAISGDYWIEHIDSSPLKQFARKFVHLNMAVNVSDYPVVKNQFSNQGARKFFYIGRYGTFADEKGVHLLEALAARIPGFKGGYICAGGEIKGWNKICEPTMLTSGLMREIAEEYDIFINMSRADAQATTVLEAISWGFPVACTKQSGYSNESDLFYLSLDDMEANVRIIDLIQSMPSDELSLKACSARRVVESKYSWQNFLFQFGAHFGG